MTARELGRITLGESLALTALVVLLEEDELLTIEEAGFAASAPCKTRVSRR